MLTTAECSAYYQPKISNVSVSLEYDLGICANERSATVNNSFSMLKNTKDDNDSKMSSLNEFLLDCQQKDVHYDAVRCYQDSQGSIVVMQTSSNARIALKQHELNMSMLDMVYNNCMFSASNRANIETQQLFSDYNYCVVKGELPNPLAKRI